MELFSAAEAPVGTAPPAAVAPLEFAAPSPAQMSVGVTFRRSPSHQTSAQPACSTTVAIAEPSIPKPGSYAKPATGVVPSATPKTTNGVVPPLLRSPSSTVCVKFQLACRPNAAHGLSSFQTTSANRTPKSARLARASTVTPLFARCSMVKNAALSAIATTWLPDVWSVRW